MYQVCETKDHPELEQAHQQFVFGKKKLTNAINDLENQAVEKLAAYDKEHEEGWNKIYDYVEKHKLVRPGYSRKASAFSFDDEHGVLFCSNDRVNDDECGHSMLDHFKMYAANLFGRFRR